MRGSSSWEKRRGRSRIRLVRYSSGRVVNSPIRFSKSADLELWTSLGSTRFHVSLTALRLPVRLRYAAVTWIANSRIFGPIIFSRLVALLLADGLRIFGWEIYEGSFSRSLTLYPPGSSPRGIQPRFYAILDWRKRPSQTFGGFDELSNYKGVILLRRIVEPCPILSTDDVFSATSSAIAGLVQTGLSRAQVRGLLRFARSTGKGVRE